MRSGFAIGQIGRRAVQVAVLAGVVTSMASSAYAQSTGASQKPYVMIMMDTSASMEWTDEGDEEYPKAADGTAPWESGQDILSTERFGPCYVWKAECNDYDRPSWNTSSDWSDNYSDSPISSRLVDMRGTATNPGPRLQNKSQPRHVTIKEILTGEMVLKREGDSRAIGDLSPSADAPGCWFVPRQRTATIQQGRDLCVDNSNNPPDYNKFDKYPDATESRPHFQEVFDGQLPNGLMDTVGSNAIFAVAMFDGYKDREDDAVNGWDGHRGAKKLDDSMDHDNAFAGLIEGHGESDKAGEPEHYNYNLGVFQMVAPEKLEASSSIAGQISGFVQYALVDAGFLSEGDDYKLKPDGNDDDDEILGQVLSGAKDIEFAKALKDYFHDYKLGRQPMARATPLAAAIYDIHQYFAHGENGDVNKDSPIIKDSYKNCRPKHVIMLTDGYPEPERAGGVDLGTDSLTSAFGYDKRQYPYPFTEKAIEAFVTDSKFDSPDPADGFPMTPRYTSSYPYSDSYLVGSWNAGTSSDSYLDACRYNPRVHVVGQIGLADNTTSTPADPIEDKVVHKLAKMGVAGRTCAGQYLGTDWIPTGFEDGEGNDGTCDPSSRACLDQRQAEFMVSEAYDFIKLDGSTVPCNFPSLILSSSNEDTNMVSYTADALQLLFNSIVGSGLQSRTRPTFVNRLDDPNFDLGGQYRVFSGVSVDKGEIFWRGLMYRQDRVCANSGSTSSISESSVDLHTQIDALAGEVGDPDAVNDNFDTGSVSDDRRRIFTSFATNDSFDYTNRKASSLATDGSRHRFWFGMDLVGAGDDEFIDRSGVDNTYLGFDPEALLGRRISFEYDDLETVIKNLTGDDTGASLLDYFNVVEKDDLEQLIHEVRGRSNAKDGRAFGAILNSSPVAVEPPSLDLPIDSYREYKALYANRPSMIYVATTDGLLHAIHAGELDDGGSHNQIMKRNSSGSEVSGSMHDQREAWAYIPQMLHKKLALYKGQPPSLMDGTPSVKDVRLCYGNNDYNLNKQACACSGTNCNVDPVDQWRTVLVQGLGGVEGGTGYFALDVTRPGGKSAESSDSDQIEPPDPIPLWEIDPNWERGQVEVLASNGKQSLVYPPSELRDQPNINECDDDEGDADYFWDQPFMGASVGEAAIGTLALNDDFTTASSQKRLRRPVAVISGGAAAEFGTSCDRDLRSGRAIYVVDLQTGTLLRRFVSYIDDAGDPALFQDAITGSPALYNSSPGSLATRAFVGDGAGRLFRIDFSNDDPEEWEVELFFDPANNSDISATGPFGPASYKPAIAMGTDAVNNDLLVFYGLGERGDLSSTGTTQMMIAVRESITTTLDSGEYVTRANGEHLWSLEFQDKDDDQVEKLTSEAVVFNKGVYFTTFVEPAGDRCEAGWSRIYGLGFEGDGGTAEGLWTDADLASGTKGYGGTATTHWAYEPLDPGSLTAPDVVRGLTITLGATCLSSPNSATGGTVQSQPKQPTLIAQSSSNQMSGGSGDSFDDGTSTNNGKLHSIEQKLDELESQNIPLSWAIIDN